MRRCFQDEEERTVYLAGGLNPHPLLGPLLGKVEQNTTFEKSGAKYHF
jgi:hypothetical protein